MPDVEQMLKAGAARAEYLKCSLRADFLVLAAGSAVEEARERNERWEGVFEPRFDVAAAYGWQDA